MTQSELSLIVQKLKTLIMTPITFQDISAELLDAKISGHDSLWVCPKHHHPWFEFIYINEGEFTTVIDDQPLSILPGRSLLIPPGVTHSHYHSKDVGDMGLCLRWKINTPSEKKNFSKNFRRAISTMHKEPFEIDLSDFLVTKGHMHMQISFINWLISLAEIWNTKETAYTHTENRISSQIIMYLEEYYNKEITMNDIALSLNMSYRNLSRNFKKETGITIIEKLNEIRIAQAKRLLMSTQLPIYEIATMVGYENGYYFSNAFKKYAATTPSFFRKNNRL